MESAIEINKSVGSSSKVALITGGTAGIGKETALILAQKGAKVVVSGRHKGVGNNSSWISTLKG